MAGLFFQQYSKLSIPITLVHQLIWLEADYGITSSPVSLWLDRSVNGCNAIQNVAINQPTLVANSQNGLPAVVFDAINDFMITSPVALTGKYFTGYYVFKYIPTDAPNNDLLVFCTSNYTESGSIYFSLNQKLATPGYHGNVGYSQKNFNNVSNYNQFTQQLDINLATKEATTFINGVLNSGTYDFNANNTADLTAKPLRIAIPSGSLCYSKLYLCAVICYSDFHDATTRLQIQNYLKNKWGTP